MQVPFARFAIDPGKRFLQPGDEVIAPRLVAVPPAALDALGPGEQRELRLGDAARRLEQPQRPRAGLPELARVPFARLDAPPGVLGPVVGLHREAADRALPPGARRAAPRAAAAAGAPGKAALRRASFPSPARAWRRSAAAEQKKH